MALSNIKPTDTSAIYTYEQYGHVYIPNPDEADQGATGNGKSVKAIVDDVGTSESATIVFLHNQGSNTTTYTFTTDETIPSNFRVIVQNGAILDGAGTLTINGPFEAGLYQVFGSSITVSFGAGAVEVTRPEWWGNNTTPGTTDMTAEIQAAITSLASVGGTVWFNPNSRYLVTDNITNTSLYPIHLRSNMKGALWTPSTVNLPGIIIGANITGSMITYTAPNSGQRSRHGGGVISGLNFYDATGSGSDPGTYTCTSILNLNDFALSRVEDCTFQWINGSAILGEFVVMSSIVGNTVRYSGAASKPVFNFPSTVAGYPAQSLLIEDNRLEVCQDAAYISIGANSDQVKIIANGLECDTSVAVSNQEYITYAGNAGSISNNHFNRNTGNMITVSGHYNTISDNSFGGHANSATILVISGNVNTVTGNTFATTRTGVDISVTGTNNTLSGNTLYCSGGVKMAGAGNVFTGNSLYVLYCTTAGLGAGDDFWVHTTGTGCAVYGNTFNNNNGSVTTVGGVKLTGTIPSCTGNTFRVFGGTGNGAIAIYNTSVNACIVGNAETGCTTLISTTSYVGEISGNMPTTSGQILEGSDTWDPASIAVGAMEAKAVTVTGAALGDFAEASFSLDLTDLVLNAQVTGANTVTCVLANNTAGAVDLASGTIKAKVRKR